MVDGGIIFKNPTLAQDNKKRSKFMKLLLN